MFISYIYHVVIIHGKIGFLTIWVLVIFDEESVCRDWVLPLGFDLGNLSNFMYLGSWQFVIIFVDVIDNWSIVMKYVANFDLEICWILFWIGLGLFFLTLCNWVGKDLVAVDLVRKKELGICIMYVMLGYEDLVSYIIYYSNRYSSLYMHLCQILFVDNQMQIWIRVFFFLLLDCTAIGIILRLSMNLFPD